MKSNCRFLNRAAVLVAGVLVVSGVLAADIYSPYRVLYEVSRDDSRIGTAVYEVIGTEAGCFRYQGQAVPEGLAALLVPVRNERSEFCLRDNQLTPRSYHQWEGPADKLASHDAAAASDGDDDVDDHNYRAIFTEDGRSGRTNALKSRSLPPATVDNQSLHFAIRKAVAERLPAENHEPFEITVFKENKLKRYRFKITGSGHMDTPAGRFETVKVDRIDDPDKRLIFWLASDRDFLPVRVTRSKKGRSELSMTLKKIY